jgi:hypothetical protein
MGSKSSSGNVSTTTTTTADSYNRTNYTLNTDSGNKITATYGSTVDLSRVFDYSNRSTTNAGSNSFTPPIPTATGGDEIAANAAGALSRIDPKLLAAAAIAAAAVLFLNRKK